MRNFDVGFNSSIKNDAYEYFGSFLEGDRATFRVWAPNATALSVVGDFNDWNDGCNPMYPIANGVWQAEISGVKNFDSYKYAITSPDGKVTLKSDPYARHFETAPANASKVYSEDNYAWGDSEWTFAQSQKDIMNSPVNIYEVHFSHIL